MNGSRNDPRAFLGSAFLTKTGVVGLEVPTACELLVVLFTASW